MRWLEGMLHGLEGMLHGVISSRIGAGAHAATATQRAKRGVSSRSQSLLAPELQLAGAPAPVLQLAGAPAPVLELLSRTVPTAAGWASSAAAWAVPTFLVRLPMAAAPPL